MSRAYAGLSKKAKNFGAKSEHMTMTLIIMFLRHRRNGECKKWSKNASREIAYLTRDVNAPLLAYLADWLKEKVDTECVDFFRYGAPLFNEGSEWQFSECKTSNNELLKRMRDDASEEALHAIAFDDWEKGRTTRPQRVTQVDTERV